jgi:hypothetical protein
MNERLLRLLKYVVGVVLIAALLYMADIRSVTSAIADVSLGDIALLSVISFLLIAVSVVKWRAFLARLGIAAGFWKLFGLYLVGYFVNLLMPSFVGGDVVRSLYIDKVSDKTHAVSATMLERYTGLVAMLAMALVSVWWAPMVTVEIKLLTVLASMGLAIGSALVFTRRASRFLELVRAPEKLLKLSRKVEDSLIAGMSDRPLLVRVFALSALFHVLTVLNTAAVGWAVGWHDIPWRDLFVVVPLILLVGAVPVSPQGLGIQEGAFLFFLHSVGATTGEALGIGLILRAKSYVLAVLGGIVWMGIKRDEKLITPRAGELTR